MPVGQKLNKGTKKEAARGIVYAPCNKEIRAMELAERYDRLNHFLEQYIHSLFPKRVYPSDRVMQILKVIYPSLNWNEINFYEGIPWFAKYVAPYVTAQALPDTYSLRKLNIYVKRYDENSCNVLADIVHEAYHMVQYERFAKAWGIGFLRTFIVYYNACYLTRGYRNNPFEIPAYEQEYAFQRFCNTHRITLNNPNDLEKLGTLVDQTQLRTHNIEYKYGGRTIHLVLSFLFTLAVAIVKPITEIILLGVYFILKGVSLLLRATLRQSRKAL